MKLNTIFKDAIATIITRNYLEDDGDSLEAFTEINEMIKNYEFDDCTQFLAMFEKICNQSVKQQVSDCFISF